MNIGIVDYGGGNMGSLLAALERRGAPYVLARDAASLRGATAGILPGDGAFGVTMEALRERGLDDAVRDLVARGAPLLGICVGMQLLYERSSEAEGVGGFGFLEGGVERFAHAPRVPHMGWNSLAILRRHPFVRGLGDGAYVYFLHSYRAPVGPSTVASATHGEGFSAIVARANVMGTQFHPEKSQRAGGVLLDNFIALVKESR